QNITMMHEARQAAARQATARVNDRRRENIPVEIDSTAVAANQKPPAFRRGSEDPKPSTDEPASATVQATAQPAPAKEHSVMKIRVVDRPAMIQAHGESGPPSMASRPSTVSTNVTASATVSTDPTPSDAPILEAAEPAVAGWQPVVRRR